MEDLLAERPVVQVKSLTFAVPLVSRKTQHLIEATARIYARLRAMGVQLLRIHTDRAKEFVSEKFQQWVRQRDIYQTFTAGDEPAGNGRVERELGLLKGRVRTLLTATKAGHLLLAFGLIRHAAEQRLRSQLWGMGIRTPALHQFGVAAVAKKKTWHNRSEPWKWPAVRVKVWGPASGMSLTSQGYFVQTEDGKWYRSTVINIPSNPERGQAVEEAAQEAVAESLEEREPGEAGEDPLWLAVDPLRMRHAEEAVPEHSSQPSDRAQPEGGESVEAVAALRLVQHSMLEELLQEEAGAMVWSDFQEGDVQRVKDLKKEVQILEKLIQEGNEKEGIKLRSLTAKIEQEVLQTRVVGLEEVRSDIAKWKPAFEKEVNSLVSGPVSRISGQEFERLKAEGDLGQQVKASRAAKVQVSSQASVREAGKAHGVVTATLALCSMALIGCGKHKLGGLLAAVAAVYGGRKSLQGGFERGKTRVESSLNGGLTAGDGVEATGAPAVRAFRGPAEGYHHQPADDRPQRGGDQSGSQRPIPPAVARARAVMRPDLLDMRGPGSSTPCSSEVSGDRASSPGGISDFSLVQGGHELQLVRDGPWNRLEYQKPPTGAERWSMEHWDEGWILRTHSRRRQQPFQPNTRTLPCTGEQLGRRRVTVVFSRDGGEVVEDEWQEPRPWQRVDWVGYTFVEKVSTSSTRRAQLT